MLSLCPHENYCFVDVETSVISNYQGGYIRKITAVQYIQYLVLLKLNFEILFLFRAPQVHLSHGAAYVLLQAAGLLLRLRRRRYRIRHQVSEEDRKVERTFI